MKVEVLSLRLTRIENLTLIGLQSTNWYQRRTLPDFQDTNNVSSTLLQMMLALHVSMRNTINVICQSILNVTCFYLCFDQSSVPGLLKVYGFRVTLACHVPLGLQSVKKKTLCLSVSTSF